jgi:hypothetical protein
MTRIRASCPSCGEVDLRPDDVVLHVVRAPDGLISDGSEYRFRCPDCEDIVAKPADERIAQLLTTGGVAIAEAHRCSHHTPSSRPRDPGSPTTISSTSTSPSGGRAGSRSYCARRRSEPPGGCGRPRHRQAPRCTSLGSWTSRPGPRDEQLRPRRHRRRCAGDGAHDRRGRGDRHPARQPCAPRRDRCRRTSHRGLGRDQRATEGSHAASSTGSTRAWRAAKRPGPTVTDW